MADLIAIEYVRNLNSDSDDTDTSAKTSPGTATNVTEDCIGYLSMLETEIIISLQWNLHLPTGQDIFDILLQMCKQVNNSKMLQIMDVLALHVIFSDQRSYFDFIPPSHLYLACLKKTCQNILGGQKFYDEFLVFIRNDLNIDIPEIELNHPELAGKCMEMCVKESIREGVPLLLPIIHLMDENLFSPECFKAAATQDSSPLELTEHHTSGNLFKPKKSSSIFDVKKARLVKKCGDKKANQ